MLSPKYKDLLENGSKEFGISLSEDQTNKFSTYADLLVEWNDKVNLTSITDQEGIVIKHFIDSLSVYPLIGDKECTAIDVGTGAGFPGIPLKIVSGNLKVTLLDSLEKRVKFLNEICTSLNLKNTTAIHGRAEDFGRDSNYREKYDFALARAVAALPVLLEYCLPFVKVGGLFIAMKGPDLEDEIAQSEKALQVLGGELIETKTFILPYSDNERSLLLVRKCRHTSPQYPRKSGKPTKSPIK